MKNLTEILMSEAFGSSTDFSLPLRRSVQIKVNKIALEESKNKAANPVIIDITVENDRNTSVKSISQLALTYNWDNNDLKIDTFKNDLVLDEEDLLDIIKNVIKENVKDFMFQYDDVFQNLKKELEKELPKYITKYINNKK